MRGGTYELKQLNKIIVICILLSLFFSNTLVVFANDSIFEIIQSAKIDEKTESSFSDTIESADSDEDKPVIELEDIISEENDVLQNVGVAPFVQASDGYWLVDTVATLNTYIAEGKTHLRLQNDLDLGTAGFKLYNGFILDGNGFKITYNKAGSYRAGFYIEENDAVVTMKNIVFGHADGSGSVGYYGIVTGHSGHNNISIIFENVTYKSVNGQPIYNPNGRIILRGNNTFSQSGTSIYSQEWAETNYVEIQSGKTTVTHQGTNGDAFLYSTYGTDATNIDRYTSQVIVRSDAAFDVQTDKAFFYTAASFAHSIKVEKKGQLTITQLPGTTTVRKRFIYPDPGASGLVNFDFGDESQVNLKLNLPIQVKAAEGGMTIGQDARVSIAVDSGAVFDVNANTSKLFHVSINNSRFVDFRGTASSVLGLQSSSEAVNNFSFYGVDKMKVTNYANSEGTVEIASFVKVVTRLNLRNGLFSYIYGDVLSSDELLYMSAAKRLVFEKMQKPVILSGQVTEVTDAAAKLSVTANNNGNAANEVKYLLFTSKDETGKLENAKHIEKLTNLPGDMTDIHQYDLKIEGLNPNTTYWLQGVVTNEIGSSAYSEPVAFSTSPQLARLDVTDVSPTSARVRGALASDTGVWTNFQNGEAAPVPNQQADYGGNYQKVFIEYSEHLDFSVYQSVVGALAGAKNEEFVADLIGLIPETTYYVRIRAIGVNEEETLLMKEPLTQFTTAPKPNDLISVEVPLEMTFETKNSDLIGPAAGTIYAKSDDYRLINKGNVETKVTAVGFEGKNAAANTLQLLPSLEAGQMGENALALQLIVPGSPPITTFLTEEIAQTPVLLGTLGVQENTQMQLDFSGKFFNPFQQRLCPEYQLTLKFEKK